MATKYIIKEMETDADENQLWYIEDSAGDCLMNQFESPVAAERWLAEYLQEDID